MPEPREFPSLDSCQMRFLWAHKEVDLALHPVSGVLKVGDAEKFPQPLGLKSLDLFLRVNKQGPCLTAIEDDGHYKRLVRFELAHEWSKGNHPKEL